MTRPLKKIRTRPSYISLWPVIPWIQQKRPVEWDNFFGRSAELELEIGFGLGDFLVRQAREHPDTNFVGIELGWVPVRRALRKSALASVRNVRIFTPVTIGGILLWNLRRPYMTRFNKKE